MQIHFLYKIILTLLLFCLSLIGNAQTETPKDSISNKLNEVVITQNKKTFTNSNGNIKVDVMNSIYNTVPNPIDLLLKLPSVQNLDFELPFSYKFWTTNNSVILF